MTQLHSQGAFVLRTPALPFDAWLDWTRGGSVRALCRRPDVRDALAAGAPDLLDALDREDPGPRVDAALGRVVARMAARPTPFGLYAGWSVGRVGGQTRLEVGAADTPVSRLDAGLLLGLVHGLTADPAVREEARWHPNPNLYRSGGRLRYVEARPEGGRLHRRLVAVEADADLDRLLAAAAGGAPWKSLVAALEADGADGADAMSYVHEAADAQVLVPDIGLAVVGSPPGPALVRRLAACTAPAARRAARVLAEVQHDLAEADARPGARAGTHAAAARKLAELGLHPDRRGIVQVDLRRRATGLSLPPAVLEELREGVEVLRRLPAPADDGLRAFTARFAARYGTAVVALAEALDPDAGVDFDAAGPPPAAGDPGAGTPTAQAATAGADRLRLDLLLEAAATGAREAVLDPSRLAGLPPAPLPGAFAVVAAIAAGSADAIDTGRFLVRLIGAAGPSGATLLGRFCHADPELEAVVREHLAAEAEREPDAILAEISHLPDGRAGNVLLRPRLRRYEIALDAQSAAPAPDRLDLADLRLRVAGGRLELWSARLGRRVLPRLTSAHDPRAEGIGLYRFLVALAADGAASGLAWTWGSLAPSFTPRVRCGRAVLALARWTVEPAELEVVRRGDPGAVRAWREARGLPRIVGLDGPDAPLPADLETPAGLALVARERPHALVEWWPAADDLPVRGPGGRYVHELVVPFTRPPDPRKREGRAVASPGLRGRRTFPPGSGWLYAKLYAGEAAHDRLLVEDIAPLARRAVDAGDADHWHVLRYADPDPHLRVRFCGDPVRLRERVQAELETAGGAAIADGRAWRLALDTYEREIERFGGPDGMQAAEELFAADSDLVCRLLAFEPPGEDAARRRWMLGAATSLRLLLDLGAGREQARSLLDRCRGDLGAARRRAFAAARRAARAEIEPLAAAALGRDGGAPGLAEALDERTARIRPLAGRLPPDLVAPSVVHLHLNRLLRAPAHEHEAAACDAAERILAGDLARAGARR